MRIERRHTQVCRPATRASEPRIPDGQPQIDAKIASNTG